MKHALQKVEFKFQENIFLLAAKIYSSATYEGNTH